MSDQQFRRDLICAALAGRSANYMRANGKSAALEAAVVIELADAALAAAVKERDEVREGLRFERKMVDNESRKLAAITAERDALKAKVELATKCLEGLAFGLDSFGGRINRLKMMEAARQSLDAILNDAREGGEG